MWNGNVERVGNLGVGVQPIGCGSWSQSPGFHDEIGLTSFKNLWIHIILPLVMLPKSKVSIGKSNELI